MDFSEYFPIFDQLTPVQQQSLTQSAVLRKVPAGTMLHNGSADCRGLIVLRKGQLRAYMTSEEGREVTLYRLLSGDICLFSASCMLSSLQIDIMISAEKETEFWIVPPQVYKDIMEHSLAVSNYTNQLLTARIADMMWLIDQILWKRMDARLAKLLLQELELAKTPVLRLTHVQLASHLGTAREVVTRMLKYFQQEGMVKLTRGEIEITDKAMLELLSEG